MQGLWVSLKDNVKCGNITDVVRQPAKYGRGSRRRCVPEKEKMNKGDDDNGPLMEIPPPSNLLLSRPSNTLTRLYELGIGDPSRKIVEMIFQKAWMNTAKSPRKVRTVLRVNYSIQVLERFEKYREKVKKNACEQWPRHPRSMVDGNELLRFYVTTVRCFQGKPVEKVCKDPSCRLCEIIQFNFNNQSAEIKPNSRNNNLSNRTTAIARVKNVKRAAIVCRIIAGTAVNEVDGEYEEKSNSIRLGEMQFSLERFVVKNPSSILPCFVIIFS